MVTVILAPGKGQEDLTEAREALMRSTPSFRGEVGRTIHRKRVPEIVLDVRLAAEVSHG
jgi:hypothetical protein